MNCTYIDWGTRDNINTIPSCATTQLGGETTFVRCAALLDQKASLEAVVFAVGNMVQYRHHKQMIRSYKRFVMITVFYVHLFAVAT
jgi:hypothetical protein